MRARTAPVAALLFTSGFCALVYQVSWLREFRLIFGASTLASAAVLVTIGLLFLQERIELWLQAAGAAVALTLVWTLTR